jgi:hypothetical protein
VIAGAPLIGAERPAYVVMTGDWANALNSNNTRSVTNRKSGLDRVTAQRRGCTHVVEARDSPWTSVRSRIGPRIETPRLRLAVLLFVMDSVVMSAPSTVYLLDGLQKQIDGMLGDLPAVFGSFLDRKPKVDAD